MQALLQITTGTAPSRTVALDQTVVRIGSLSDADVVIPSIPNHALTLRKKRGEYIAFNRGDISIFMGGKPVLPAESVTWVVGQDLTIGESVTLRLDNGTHEPQKKAREQATKNNNKSESQAGSDDGANQAKQSNKRPLLIGGVVCAALMLCVVVSGGASTSSARKQFHELIVRLETKVPDVDTKLIRVRQLMQEARVADLRDNDEAAVREYLSARSQLTERRRPSDPLAGVSEVRELEEEALKFINHQLDRLFPMVN